MILVDTSVWISVLRWKRGPLAATFQALLESDLILLATPVRTELIAGARSADRPALQRALTALPIAYPTDDTWKLMDAWAVRAGDAGQRFGLGDLLIAALADEADALIWSLDADFERMSKLKLVRLYES